MHAKRAVYILCQIWDDNEYICVVVSQIITTFGECVYASSPVFIATVFFFWFRVHAETRSGY